jgi:hypothetical protein
MDGRLAAGCERSLFLAFSHTTEPPPSSQTPQPILTKPASYKPAPPDRPRRDRYHPPQAADGVMVVTPRAPRVGLWIWIQRDEGADVLG